MARILLGVAILFSLVSGFFSLSTKSKLSEAREEAAAAKATANNTAGEVSKAQEELKTLKEQLATTNTAKEAAEGEIATAKATAEKAAADLQAVQAQITSKDTEIEELKAKVAAAPTETPVQSGPDPSVLEQQLKEVQTKLEEQQQIAKSLERQSQEATQRASSLEAEQKRRQAGLNAPGLEGTVLAVNGSWNFVVLNIGDRQGVAPNSTLVVKRGRQMVGRLRVTSVDPATSIADIIPGSGPKGAYVRPGDSVIFSGGIPTPEAPAATSGS